MRIQADRRAEVGHRLVEVAQLSVRKTAGDVIRVVVLQADRRGEVFDGVGELAFAKPCRRPADEDQRIAGIALAGPVEIGNRCVVVAFFQGRGAQLQAGVGALLTALFSHVSLRIERHHFLKLGGGGSVILGGQKAGGAEKVGRCVAVVQPDGFVEIGRASFRRSSCR